MDDKEEMVAEQEVSLAALLICCCRDFIICYQASCGEYALFKWTVRGSHHILTLFPFEEHFIACAAFHPFSEGFAVVHKSAIQCLIGPVSASTI